MIRLLIRLRWRTFCLGMILLSVVLSCYAQKRETNDEFSQEAQLPRYFSSFSRNDVLAAVFPRFDKATGRVADILDENDQPSLVRVDQARLWKSGGKNYLVVMIDISRYSEQFGKFGLCGACGASSPIAVLSLVNNKLELVAKQETEFYSSKNGEDTSTGFEAFWHTGHDYDVTFDLAPYRLTNNEMLIGMRYQHMWIPAMSFSTTLLLYRIEGKRIRKVFEELVVDRDWKNAPTKRFPIEKTTSTLMAVSSQGSFNDLVVTRKTYRCFTDWETYDCEGGKLLRINRETWQFNGTSFVKK